VPRTAQYGQLREWLYYRKVRILVASAPNKVADQVAAMEQDFPASSLLDDVLTEQIFAQGLGLRDLNAAEATFHRLLSAFPRGNAVDNAYTWMAIIYRCHGRVQDAENMNLQIIRRFPMTRHAIYARERLASPTTCSNNNR
jgi:TolA-binding protein